MKKVKIASEASRVQHEIAAGAREQLGVFKRRTTGVLQKKITDTDKKLEKAQKLAEELQKTTANLELEKTAAIEHADAISASVINKNVQNSHLFLFFMRERI